MARGGGIGNGNYVRGKFQPFARDCGRDFNLPLLLKGTGQRSSSGRGNWRGRGSFKSFRGRGRGGGQGGANAGDRAATLTTQDGTADEARLEDEAARHALDEKFGFLRYQEGQ